MLGWERAESTGGWLRGDFFMNVCLASGGNWCVLCGKASKGSHGGWFQWWGRCAYTVELVKPADPEGTEGVAWGGEAELQGAT